MKVITSKIKVTGLIGFLLAPFSGFFLVNVTAISPIYFFSLFAFFFASIYLLINPVLLYRKLFQIIFLYLCYIVCSQILLTPDTSAFLNIILNILYLLLGLLIFPKLDTAQILRICKAFIYVSIILLTVESIYRISHPVFLVPGATKDYRDMEGMVFYAYKVSSIMFPDSNFVGTYAMCVFFLNFFLFKEKLLTNKSTLFILFGLIVATLSRSAIFSTLLSFLLLPFLLKKVTIMKQLLIFSLVAVFSISVFILLANDPSFASKFKILQLTADHFEKSNFLQLMLGVGFGNTVLHLGMGAHNLFVTHLVESGLVGLFLFLFFQLYLIYKSKRRTLYLTLPLFISGFSLVGHAIPYYYVSLAIIYSLSKRI